MNTIITGIVIILFGAVALLAVVVAIYWQDKAEKEHSTSEYYRDRFLQSNQQSGRFYAMGYNAGVSDYAKVAKKED